MSLVRAIGWPYWSYHVLALGIGAVCYVVSGMLTHAYIEKRAPEFLRDGEVMPGVKNWELTAGVGIVPRWVSLIGVIGMGFALASPFELLASLFRVMLSVAVNCGCVLFQTSLILSVRPRLVWEKVKGRLSFMFV